MSSVVAAANSLHEGRGVRGLTAMGLRERAKRVRTEQKRRRIHHSTDCSGEAWYRQIEAELFSNEHFGRYWKFYQVVRSSSS